MGFAVHDNMVRVDFFKESGKWYTTEEMNWVQYTSGERGEIELIHDIFRRCLKRAFGDRFKGMTAVCLEPYHEHSHPLMIRNWSDEPRTSKEDQTDVERTKLT